VLTETGSCHTTAVTTSTAKPTTSFITDQARHDAPTGQLQKSLSCGEQLKTNRIHTEETIPKVLFIHE